MYWVPARPWTGFIIGIDRYIGLVDEPYSRGPVLHTHAGWDSYRMLGLAVWADVEYEVGEES